MNGEAGGTTGCFVEITNISSLLDESTLRELFECCGEIVSINMRHDNDEGRVCLIQFKSMQESEAAAMLSGTSLGDKSIQVKIKDYAEIEDKIACTEVHDAGAIDEVEAARRKVEEWANAPAQPVDQSKLTEYDKRRESQIKRSIYVGNLCPQIKEEHVRSFFSTQGNIKLIRMSGPGMDNHYCFVEFYEEAAAERSHSLTGTILGDRAIRIGNVKAPIQGSTTSAMSILSNPMKLSQAMTNARFALEAIVKKKKGVSNLNTGSSGESKKRKRRSRSRSPRRRSRSRRSRSRRSRSRRSRSRRSRSYRKRSRSRSRSRRSRRRRRRRRSSRGSSSRSRSRARRRTAIAGAIGGRRDSKQAEMVWDGFNWFPKGSIEAEATKKAQEISAKPVSAGNTVTGLSLAQEALKSFNSRNAFAPPGL